MTTTLVDSTKQLRTLIHYVTSNERPDWLAIPTSIEDVALRAGVSKILGWLRAMSMSKRIRELRLSSQPWSDIVRCIAKSSVFIELGNEQDTVVLSESLADDEKAALCDTALEYRPRLMT